MSTDPGPGDDRAVDVEALWRVLATRRDHRHFHHTPVPRETIERLLGVFAVAPSVGLSQPWHVTSFVDPDHFSGSVPLPEDARPLAYHCLGHPALELKESLLQTVDWV